MTDATLRTVASPPAEAAHARLPRTGTGVREPGWWGMVCVCVSEASLFLYLLGSWFYLRGTVTAFAAEGGRHAPLVLPALLTGVLVSSSATLRWGERGIIAGHARRLRTGLVLTILLGSAFVGLQLVEYAKEEHMPQTDAYWSAFYTITAIHGMHVLFGVLLLAFTLVRTARGHFTADRHLAVQNAALYWHTVDAVWIAIVACLYVAPYLW